MRIGPMEWKNVYKGMLMGITELIPGVSAGTIAVMLGIYDRLVMAISGFFSREWKRHLVFLVPIGIGMGVALILFSRLITYLLSEHYVATMFFFTGLIVGIIPSIARQAEVKRNFGISHYVIVFIGIGLAASMAFFSSDETASPVTSINLTEGIGYFFAGGLASMAMLLPGISGSFVLLVIGVYPTATHALATFNIPIILAIGSGVIVGFILTSKLIRYFLDRYTTVMYAIILGMISGSIAVIFPGLPDSTPLFIVSAITFLSGLSLTFLLSMKRPHLTEKA